MTRPIVERILLVAARQNGGKSTQLKSMLRDPRLRTQRGKGRTKNLYHLSPDRRLLVMMNSPHERPESFAIYVQKVAKHLKPGRWCIALATQGATIRWRFRFGPGLSQSVRGVTLMRVRDGKIVEALAYAKSGDTPVANAVRSAGSPDAVARS